MNKKQRRSRDVPLQEIETISNGMTECMNKPSSEDAFSISISPSNKLTTIHTNSTCNDECDDYDEKKIKSTKSEPLINELKLNHTLPPPPLNVRPVTPPLSPRKTKYSNIFQIRKDIKKSPKHITIYNKKSNSSSNQKHQRHHYVLETSDNMDREELLWTTQIENVIKGWHNNCLEFARIHKNRHKHHKKIFYAISIPSTIIPLTMAAFKQELTVDCSYNIIGTVFLVISGILNTILGILNPGKRSATHLNFEALYNELAVEITGELVKPQRHRQAADVFIQRIMDKYNSLNNRAPDT